MPTPSDEHIRPTLQIAVLGVPMVTWNSRALPIARRQTRALLYRLAIPLTPVPRTQLCYLFWPDVPDATARRNLTHLLTLLRRALPQPDLLVIEAETVGFLPHQVWSDADAFARLTRTAGAQTRPAALIEAIDLCRGPLLDGFALPNCPEFESWLDLERSTWERRFDDAMAAVVEIHTVAGNFGAAIATAERYLRRDDVAEEMHRRLIALYAAAGNRTAALRQFEQCVIVLERELGVGPLPETRAVYEAVRDGFFPLSPQAVPRPAPLAALARQTTGTTGSTPSPPSPLIGRTSVLNEVIALLRSPDLRLLTCCGPGGAGKTRLALEAIRSLAAEFADGVVFVPLATLRDPALVIPAIVAALGLAEHDARPPLVHLQDALRTRELLLVLDNFEHVAEAARDVAALLAAAPRLKLLVTSRALLRIAGEHAYPVPPLDLPDVGHLPPPTELAEVGAVALFLTRVRERMSDFHISENNATDIATICARLDGLPLAIELAAARAALLSPRMLLARLDRRLHLLTEGPRDLPERQRTLRATIDWSYDLLDVGEQLLLGRMAVFAGGWTLDSAEQVSMTVGPLTMSVLDGLHVLLDKHLVQRTTGSDGEPRFMMLETIREYALERLTERGESAATQHAHAAYFRDLAERAASLLHGPEQLAWLDRLDEEHANLHVALAWLLDTGDLAGVLRLATSLSWFWYVRGHFGEGHAWLSRVLQEIAREPDLLASQLPNHTSLVARARLATSDFVLKRGELGAARDQFVVLLEDLRRLDDILGGDAEVRELMARTIISLLQAEGMLANHPDQLLIDELTALVRTLNDPQIVAFHALNHGRGLLYGLGRPDLARPWLQQAEALFQHLGDIYQLAMLTADLGMLAMFAGDLADAQRRFAEASAKAVALRDRFLEAEASNNLGEVARLADDDDAAERHYLASLKLHHDMGTQVEAQRLIHNLGYLALHRGNRTLARARFAKSLTGFRAVGQVHGQVDAVAGLACVAASAGNVEQARHAACLWGAADADHGTLRTTRWPADQAERTRYEPLARALLGDAEYEAAYLAGVALSLDEAVAEAWHV